MKKLLFLCLIFAGCETPETDFDRDCKRAKDRLDSMNVYIGAAAQADKIIDSVYRYNNK